jgi:hypothetical protein
MSGDVDLAVRRKANERTGHMIGCSSFNCSAVVRAGAVVSLLVLVAFAPCARGGCSALVTSRNGLAGHNRLGDSLIANLSGGDSRQSELPSSPLAPRPCTGAWCSGQPAAPTAPPGASGGPIDSWAWYISRTGSVDLYSCFSSEVERDPCPVRRDGSVFRPPRRLSSV